MKNNFKKIFITGGAGFIGSHVSEAFFENFKKSKIIILDKLTYAGNKAFLSSIINSKRVKFIKGDIANTKKYTKYLKNCDLAINIAAESHVDNSFLSPLNFTKTNTLGAHAFFLECIKNKVKKILHISSDEVYGEKTKGTSYEDQLVNPTNPYSASKAAAEILINSYKYTYKKEIIMVRANNIYGIRQFPEKLISTSIVNLIQKKTIPIHGNGQNIRYYLSAIDFANALIILVKKKDSGTYNIGSNYFEKNINIAKKICELFKKNPIKNIAFTKDRLYNDKRYSVSSKKIRKLGWKPQRSLLKDLPMMIEWYQKNYKIFNKV
jgi:UDP-glucose 4,6-dehydratase|tara:strand:- start:2354 stop:3319 length:966 start_codon:yes stop_codon:yes gene_type:complete